MKRQAGRSDKMNKEQSADPRDLIRVKNML